MALFRALRRARRTAAPAPAGPAPHLAPDHEVLLDAPGPRLGPALVRAASGEYEAAAKLLAVTRENGEWELRDRVTRRLATFARRRGEWFADWQRAAPHDPDMLLVKAQLTLRQGWESPARTQLLRSAAPLITAAAEGDPRDPVPWRLALDHARATNASHTDFGLLWDQAVDRAPHHYGCHVAALTYLSADWYGSHKECLDFAERAAEGAPDCSLLGALPARAALTCLSAVHPGAARGLAPALPRERLDRAADLAVALSAAHPAHELWPAEVRNVLVCVLAHLGRPGEALEQLRLLGPYATSYPWDRYAEDPLAHFLGVRKALRAEAARARTAAERRRARPARYRTRP